MADFQDIYTDVMDTINRPTSETTVLAACKKRVNDAIRLIQRKRAFRLTERLAQFTYPANALMVDLTEVCEGTLRDLICTQLLGETTANGGLILPYMSYAQLQAARGKYQRMNQVPNISEWQYITEQVGHETYSTYVHKYYVFLINNKIGLYPTPTNDVELLPFVHIWLADLVEDIDTNFLLDWGYDLIHTLAVHKMNQYLKQDSAYALTKEELTEALDALVLLDSQMTETYITNAT